MTENGVLEIVKSDVWQAVGLSQVLGSSKNQLALFKFLLDHKFNSPETLLKTKDIAIKVFDKDESFSAKKDSIVRVEMFRLRANLTVFNQESDLYQIALPNSSYELQIEELQQVNVVELPSNVETQGLVTQNKKNFLGAGLAVVAGAVIVMSSGAFKSEGGFNSEPKGIDCSVAMPNLEIAQPANRSELDDYVHNVISGAASQFSHFNIVQDVESCASSNVPGYKLKFALLQSAGDFQGSLTVLSEPNAKIIGVDNFSGVSTGRAPNPSLQREDLYFTLAKITNDLLKPNGVVHRDAINQAWNNEGLLEDYSCLLKMHESFVSDSDADYYEGLKCLKTAYENGTTSLDNLGGLAASYLEQAQGNRGTNGEDPLMRATLILDDIGNKWPQSAESTMAKIMYDTVREDYNEQRLRKTLLQAEKNYTSHPHVMTEIARYSGFMLGDWDFAIKVMDKSRRLMSDKDNSVYLVDAAYAVLGKGGPSAWTNCLKAYSEHSRVSNLLVHACAVKYKNADWETRTAENLVKFNLMRLDDRAAFIENMGFEPRLSAELLKEPEDNLYD